MFLTFQQVKHLLIVKKYSNKAVSKIEMGDTFKFVNEKFS